MKKFIKKIDQENIDKMFEIIGFGLSDDQNMKIIESVLNEYIVQYNVTEENFNVDHFLEFFKAEIGDLDEIIEEFEQMQQEIINSKVLVFKVSIDGYENNYRIIEIPEALKLCNLNYVILASFEIFEGYEYVSYCKNSKYYSMNYYSEENDEEYEYDNMISLALLNLEIDDELCLVYNDSWDFTIKLIDIKDNNGTILEPILAKKHGVPLYVDDSIAFGLLYNDDLEGLKEEYENNIDYELFLKEYNSRNRKPSRSKFLNMIEEVVNIYNFQDEFDDEFDDYDDFMNEYENRMSILKEREKREIKIKNLPHIKEYLYSKDLCDKVMKKLVDFLETNEEEFRTMANEALSKERGYHLPEAISIESIKLDSSMSDLLYTSYIFPINKYFKSVSEVFKDEKRLVLEESYMLNSLINNHYGLFRIVGYDYDNAIVLFEDMITKKEYEVVDMNLSFALEHESNWPFICGRLVTYNTRTFILCAIFMDEDKELDKFIKKKSKEDSYNPLSLFMELIFLYNKKSKL